MSPRRWNRHCSLQGNCTPHMMSSAPGWTKWRWSCFHMKLRFWREKPQTKHKCDKKYAIIYRFWISLWSFRESLIHKEWDDNFLVSLLICWRMPWWAGICQKLASDQLIKLVESWRWKHSIMICFWSYNWEYSLLHKRQNDEKVK